MSQQRAANAPIASHTVLSQAASSQTNSGEPAEACSTRFAIFSECPQCGHALHAEHAHYKCAGCGWRDSCCD
jgi:transposase-like protein